VATRVNLPGEVFNTPRRDTLARSMFSALRLYWITTKGYRLRPWASPYIQWRLETFYGSEARELGARKFFQLMWRDRARIERHLEWVAEMKRAARRR
jgi:hypothetical protein